METYLQFDSVYIGIRWNAKRINDLVENMFAPWRVSPRRPAQLWEITALDSGFYFKTLQSSFPCANENALAANLEYQLTLLAQEAYADYLQLHASCIDYQGNGALFVGPHGSGKTTLALTAISSGLRALTDDVAIVGGNHSQVMGFPRPFKVCADTWNMQPSVVPGDCPCFKVTPETTYLFFYLPHRRYYAESTRLRHIIFPVRDGSPTAVHGLGETESLRRLLLQGFNCYQKKNGRVDELLDTIRKTRSFEIRYHSNFDLMEKVRELLE